MVLAKQEYQHGEQDLRVYRTLHHSRFGLAAEGYGAGCALVHKDWQFRLTVSTIAMLLPFMLTVLLLWQDRRAQRFSLSGKIGLTLAVLSIGLAWNPIHDGIARARQIRNLAMRDVAAPAFDWGD